MEFLCHDFRTSNGTIFVLHNLDPDQCSYSANLTTTKLSVRKSGNVLAPILAAESYSRSHILHGEAQICKMCVHDGRVCICYLCAVISIQFELAFDVNVMARRR